MMQEARRTRIEQFERSCRERRLPVTTQRRAVLAEILAHTDHPTADQIYDALKRRLPGLSRTTVYRILYTLVQFGIITKICHPGSAARFDPRIEQHHHLICMRCESIIDLDAGHLSKITWPDVRGLGFEIRDYHIHFRGICAGCRKKGDRGERMPRRTGRRRAAKPTRANSMRSGKRSLARDGPCGPPRARIPASGTTALGSCLG